ncbi:MAG: ABC transporter substrate-binding protein [Syntrophaceae bacterium]|nr:ABC transporter substrate-binding protein [Syntrophaceae bacterium]
MDRKRGFWKRVFPIIILCLFVALPAYGYEKRDGKKILIFGGRQPAPNIDPSQYYDWSARMLQQAMYDALLKYVGNPPKVVPWLAKSMKKSPDGLVWTFELVRNAKFHNGDPVNAQAVKWSFERTLALKKGPAWMLMDFLDSDGIRVVDDYAIEFRLKRPYAAFEMALPWWYIMNPKVVMANEKDKDFGQGWLKDHDAGSGPFRMKRWEHGVLYELEAVEDYWRGWENPKHINGFIYRIIRESSSLKMALEKGELDALEGLNSDDFDLVVKNPKVYVTNDPGWTTFGLKMNCQKGLTKDINIRKAVCYAFDYPSMIKIYNGNAILQDSPFPKGMRGYVPVPNLYRQDLKKAKEHLTKAGYPNGGFELEYVYVQALEEERQIGLVLLDNLSKLNIKLKIVPLVWPNMVARGSKVETSPDLMAVFTTPIMDDPDVVAIQYHKVSWGKYYGSHFYQNEKVWDLIEKARFTVNWPERQKLYEEIQVRIMEDAPELFGMLMNRRWAFRSHVKGFVFSPMRFTGEIDMYPLYIED